MNVATSMPATDQGLAAAVAIPARDGAETIGAALASAVTSIETSGRSVAISVVDDASSDDTAEVVRRFARDTDVPIVLTRRAARIGTGGARNQAIARVPAPMYLFLDQDDEYLAEHVGRCLAALAGAPDAGFVRTGVVLDDPVHPEWHDAIARSLVQTLGVRDTCHQLVGGFLEDAAVSTYGCDDVLYNRVLAQFFVGTTVAAATVRFHCRPGNSFDRQYDAKFTLAPRDAAPTLTPERAAVAPEVSRLYRRRVEETRRAVDRALLESARVERPPCRMGRFAISRANASREQSIQPG